MPGFGLGFVGVVVVWVVSVFGFGFAFVAHFAVYSFGNAVHEINHPQGHSAPPQRSGGAIRRRSHEAGEEFRYTLGAGALMAFVLGAALALAATGWFAAGGQSVPSFDPRGALQMHVLRQTGGAPAAFALQDKVAQAWINFARTGNPSQPGLEWKPYTVQDPEAMVFDIVSESYPLRDEKLLTLMTSRRS